MKRFFTILIVSIMLIALFCSSSVMAETIKLTAASHVPPSYPDILPVEQAFVDDINTASGGEVAIEFYHSGTLLGVNELVPGLEAGTVEIIFHTTSHTTGSWPIMGGASLPFLFANSNDLRDHFKIGSSLYNFVEDIMINDHEVMMLAYGAMPMEYIWTAEKLIKKPSDMEGLTFRVGGDVEAKAVKSLGGSPVFMPSGELYEALQRGTIDGVISYPGSIGGRSLQEVLKYCTKVPIGAYGRGIYIKKSTWENFPENIQRLFYVTAAKYDYNHLEIADNVHNEQYWGKKFVDSGMEVFVPDEDTVALFKEKCEGVWGEWSEKIGKEVGEQFIKYATK